MTVPTSRLTDVEQRVLKALPGTAAEVATATGRSVATIYVVIRALAERGLVTSRTATRPYRWERR